MNNENKEDSNFGCQDNGCSKTANPDLMSSNIFSLQNETNSCINDDCRLLLSKTVKSSESMYLSKEISEIRFRDTTKADISKLVKLDSSDELLQRRPSTNTFCSQVRSFSSGDVYCPGIDFREIGEHKVNCLSQSMAVYGKKVDASTMTLPGIWLADEDKKFESSNEKSKCDYNNVASSENMWLKYYVNAFWHLSILANIFRAQGFWEFKNSNRLSNSNPFAIFVIKLCLKPIYLLFKEFLELLMFVLFLITDNVHQVFKMFLEGSCQALITEKSTSDVPDSVKWYIQNEISKAIEAGIVQREKNCESKQSFVKLPSLKRSTPKQLRSKRQKFQYPCNFGDTMKKAQTRRYDSCSQILKSAKLSDGYVKRKHDIVNKDCLNDLNHISSQNFTNRSFSSDSTCCRIVDPIKPGDSLLTKVGSLMSSSFYKVGCTDDTECETFVLERNSTASSKCGSALEAHNWDNECETTTSDTNRTSEKANKNCSSNSFEFESDVFHVNASLKDSDACHYYNKQDLIDSVIGVQPNVDKKSSDLSCFLRDCFDTWERNEDINEDNYNEIISLHASSVKDLDKMNMSLGKNRATSSTLDNSELSQNTRTCCFGEGYKEPNKAIRKIENCYLKEKLSDRSSNEKLITDKMHENRFGDVLLNPISFKTNEVKTLDSSLRETKFGEECSKFINAPMNLQECVEKQQKLNHCLDIKEGAIAHSVSLGSVDEVLFTCYNKEKKSFLSKNKSPLSLNFNLKETRKRCSFSPKVSLMFNKLKKRQTCNSANVSKRGNSYKKHNPDG